MGSGFKRFISSRAAALCGCMLLISLIAGCADEPTVGDRDFPKASPAEAASVQVPKQQALKLVPEKIIVEKEANNPMIRPGFLILISNQEDKKLNGKFRVDLEGKLQLPYNVIIETEGLTFKELAAKVQQSYSRFFQTTSAFHIELAKKEYMIDVRGMVSKPGKISVTESDGIDSIAAKADGLKPEGGRSDSAKYVRILRHGEPEQAFELAEYYKAGASPGSVIWQGGETVIFQVDPPSAEALGRTARPTVQLMGEVSHPGDYTFQPGKDIFYYFTLANGPSTTADLTRVRVVRGPPNDRKIVSFHALKGSDQPLILPGDLILIPADRPTEIERLISRGAGIASIISVVALLIIAL